MATETEMDGKIVCRECGRAFSFLAPHLRMAHGMSVSDYRERWDIARHVPLAGKENTQPDAGKTLTNVSGAASWTLN